MFGPPTKPNRTMKVVKSPIYSKTEDPSDNTQDPSIDDESTETTPDNESQEGEGGDDQMLQSICDSLDDSQKQKLCDMLDQQLSAGKDNSDNNNSQTGAGHDDQESAQY